MRLLLIAYDIPPVASPQAIRWAYLARELARAGHDVHVLAPDLPPRPPGGLPDMEGVRMHRVHPGPIAALARRLLRTPAPAPAPAAGGTTAWTFPPDVELNWKGRLRQRIEDGLARVLRYGFDWRNNLIEMLRAMASWVMFPDVRSEWMPWARKRLDALLDELRPDAVITSHEPANTIELGLHAKRRGFTWVGDLGDPVLAPYTAPRWRKRAHAIERALCDNVDLVTVTSARTRDLLVSRHGLDARRIRVLTQGFDARSTAPADRSHFDPARLELLYTGSIYAFRRIDAILDAVAATPDARLTIASAHLPAHVVDAARAHPERIRLLGFVPHDRTLMLQRGCDVLVNIANDDPVQVPGKLYEYLGAGAPVLHVGGGDDAGTQLVRDAGLGWCEPDDAAALSARLAALRDEKRRTGRTTRPGTHGFDVSQHAWHRLAGTLAHAIATIGHEVDTARASDGMACIAQGGQR